MKTVRLLRHLKEGAEEKRGLHAAGALFGHGLLGAPVERLRELRAALAREEIPADSYASGYAAALADVAAAYEAATSSQREVASNSDALVRSPVREVVDVMREGVELPSAIASRLGKTRDVISRVLSQMREGGLAEDFDPPTNGDQRKRPHRLTARGEQLAERLPPVLSGDAERAIAFAVSAFAKLARVRDVTTSALEELATTFFPDLPGARRATQVFSDVARVDHLVDASAEVLRLRPTRADEEAHLVDLINSARHAPNSTLLACMRGVVDSGMQLLVRPNARSTKAWLVLLVTDRVLGGKARVVARPDLDVVDTGERFAVLYDSVAALLEDSSDQRFAGAERRFCIAPRGAVIGGKAEHLELEALS